MKINFIAVILCFLFFGQSCKQNKTPDSNRNDKEENKISTSEKIDEKWNEGSKSSKDSTALVYVFQNEVFFQQIEVILIDSLSFKFKLETRNFGTENSSALEGVANKIINVLGNMDFGEDEEENAYVVENYVFKRGDCKLYIDIDAENQVMLTIRENDGQDCEILRNNLATFNTDGILRLVTK